MTLQSTDLFIVLPYMLMTIASMVLVRYAFPKGGWRRGFSYPNKRIATKYSLFSTGLILAAIVLQHYYWLLLWPAVAFALVSAAYAGVGPCIFQKDTMGKSSWAARWVLLPYHLLAKLSAWYYSRRLAPYTMITPQLAVGGIRAPSKQPWDAVLDLTTEFNALNHHNYLNLPVLDITVPSAEVLKTAMRWLAQQPQDSVICIHCALGLSRSATVAAAWLVHSGQAPDAREAFIKIKLKRPIVWGMTHEHLIDEHIRPLDRS